VHKNPPAGATLNKTPDSEVRRYWTACAHRNCQKKGENNVLEAQYFEGSGESQGFMGTVRTTENPAVALQFWMAYMARGLLRLGVYSRALGIRSQIPGAANYRYLFHSDDDDTPPDADDPDEWIRGTDPGTVLGVLAECLRRLGADPDILKQITEVKHLRPKKLTAKWRKYLDREAKYECGLLNVASECIDELVLQPGWEEIDCGSESTTWWQDYWAKIEDSVELRPYYPEFKEIQR
jgi:hypothetical protein